MVKHRHRLLRPQIRAWQLREQEALSAAHPTLIVKLRELKLFRGHFTL